MNTVSPLKAFVDKMRQKNTVPVNGAMPKNLYATPIYSRYVGNTGMGNDGAVQPQNPAAMMNTAQGPRVLHEGEDLYQQQSGAVNVVPAEASITPVNGAMARAVSGLPGYAMGGTGILPVPRALKGPPSITAPKPAEQPLQFAPTGGTPPQVTKPQPTDTPLQFAPPSSGITKPTPTYEPLQLAPTTGLEPVSTPPQVKKEEPPIEALQFAPTTQTAQPSPYEQYGTALGKLSGYMEGGSPALKAIQDKYLSDLKATQGVSQRMTGFESAQSGAAPEVAAARQAMGRAVSGAQLSEAESQMAANEMQQMEQAAKDVASIGLAGAQYETGKEQWEKTFGQTQQQIDYTQGMETIKTLMAADPGMGPETIKSINDIAKKFGFTFDAKSLTTAGNSTKFAIGMDLITKGVASGMTAAEIKGSLTAMGVLDVMEAAFPNGGIDAMVGKMSTNAIDKEWADIESSQMFKGLSDTVQKQYKTVWTVMKLGGGTDLISIDENGNIVFHLDKLPGNKSGETLPPEQGPGSAVGDLYIGSDGKIYKNEGKGKKGGLIDPAGLTKKDLVGKTSDDPVVQNVMKNMDLTSNPKSLWGTGDAIMGTGKLIKIKDPADPTKEILVTYDSNYSKKTGKSLKDISLWDAAKGAVKGAVKGAIAGGPSGGAAGAIGGGLGGVYNTIKEPGSVGVMVFTTLDGRKIEIEAG
jgi:hypothetical protein